MANQNKPSIVFAHGLWADGSCFQKRRVVSQTAACSFQAAVAAWITAWPIIKQWIK